MYITLAIGTANRLRRNSCLGLPLIVSALWFFVLSSGLGHFSSDVWVDTRESHRLRVAWCFAVGVCWSTPALADDVAERRSCGCHGSTHTLVDGVPARTSFWEPAPRDRRGAEADALGVAVARRSK